jgi:hypothetical protein
MKNLDQILAKLPPARRVKIEERARSISVAYTARRPSRRAAKCKRRR